MLKSLAVLYPQGLASLILQRSRASNGLDQCPERRAKKLRICFLLTCTPRTLTAEKPHNIGIFEETRSGHLEPRWNTGRIVRRIGPIHPGHGAEVIVPPKYVRNEGRSPCRHAAHVKATRLGSRTSGNEHRRTGQPRPRGSERPRQPKDAFLTGGQGRLLSRLVYLSHGHGGELTSSIIYSIQTIIQAGSCEPRKAVGSATATEGNAQAGGGSPRCSELVVDKLNCSVDGPR